MLNLESACDQTARRLPWNKGKLIGAMRDLLLVHAAQRQSADAHIHEPPLPSYPCPCCGGRMIVIETFARGCVPTAPIRIDTS
jgi:hypothetical protein